MRITACRLLLLPLCSVAHAQAFPPGGQLDLGAEHAAAANASGVLYTWGEGDFGRLGHAASTDRTAPGGITTPESGTGVRAIALAAGENHTLAIHYSTTASVNGSVWAWGQNTNGQLGDNSVTNRSTRVRVGAFAASTNNGAVSVAAGGAHSLMALTSGIVYGWGANTSGQIGDNTTTQRLTPVQVLGVGGTGFLSGITAVSAGFNHSLALNAGTGAVYAWGAGTVGQLGDGSQLNSTVPVTPIAVLGFTNITALSAGKNFSLALKSDGTVWAWGLNDRGQLGLGDTSPRFMPTQIPGLTDVIALSAGTTHALAVRSDNTVVGWGSAADGELGATQVSDALSPIVIPGFGASALDGGGRANLAVSVSAGNKRSGALLANGGILTWGLTLGDTTTGYRETFIPVTDTKQVIDVFAGGDASFVRRENGRLFAWGDNAFGQLGLNDNAPVSVTPSRFAYDSDVFRNASKVVSNGHSTLVLVYGRLLALGRNTSGELGLGHASPSSGEVIPTLTEVADVALGENFAIARKTDGTLWVWGNNDAGQLGLVDTAPRLLPTQLPTLPGIGTAKPAFIGAGERHVVVIDTAGFVYVWGANELNQLGDGALVSRSTPFRLTTAIPSNYGGVAALGVGQSHNLVMTTGGRIYVWGHGAYGKLGTAASSNKTTPSLITLTGALQIAVGANHTIVRRASDVVAFGLNTSGQLGDNSVTNRSSAVDVTGLLTATSIAAGGNHSLALLANGTVVAWGDNSFRQLGYHPGRVQRVPLSIGDLAAADDTEADGMKNSWESTVNNGGSPSAGDGDSDRMSTIQEFHYGTNPKVVDSDGDGVTDFADSAPNDNQNAESFLLVALGGDQQSAPAGAQNAELLDIAAWTLDANTPVESADLTFTVLNTPPAPAVSGLLTNGIGSMPLVPVLTVQTDTEGTAQARFKQPSIAGFTTLIQATIGAEAYEFVSHSIPTTPSAYIPPLLPPLALGQTDTDGDGIPNSTEAALSLSTGTPIQSLLRNQTLPHPVPNSGQPTNSTLRFITLTPTP